MAAYPEYVWTIDHPARGRVDVRTLYDADVSGSWHELALPGGPVAAGFRIHGRASLPLGATVIGWSGGVAVFSGSVGSYAEVVDGRTRYTDVVVRGVVQHMQDDAVYSKAWLVDDHALWQDARSVPGQNLNTFKATGEVTNHDGANVIRFKNDDRINTDQRTGMVLDMGPGNTCAELWVSCLRWTGADANANLYVASSTDGITLAEETNVAALTGGTTHSLSKTWATPRRYMHVHYYRAVATTYTSDLSLIFTELKAAASSAYMDASGVQTILASDVIADTVANAGVFGLSTSTAAVEASPTNLVHMATEGAESVYDILERANSVDGRQWLLTQQTSPMVRYRSAPTDVRWYAPAGTYRIGSGAGYDVADVYSAVRVRYRTRSGAVSETTFTQTGAVLSRVSMTRTASLELQRPASSAEVAVIAAAFLAAYATPPLRAGTVTLTDGYVLTTAGACAVPLARLGVGDRIRLGGERALNYGNVTASQIIVGVRFDQDRRTADITLDSDRRAFDRMLSRFNAGLPWSRTTGRM